MATLNWIGKEAVVTHDKEVPFKLLKKVKGASMGERSKNLIMHGDNLEALKALMPYYFGKIKCVYIDPPYNTGSEEWVYNDKVDSPKIKQWLGNVVGRESEDLTRHDKWLSMMYPRMSLLKDLLHTEGVIFVSVDDHEVGNSKYLLDEIFLRKNFLGTIVWRNVTDNNPSRVAVEHEYIHCYAKDISQLAPVWKSKISAAKDILIEIGKKLIKQYKDATQLQEEYGKWFKTNKQYLGKLDRYKYIDSGGVYTGSQSVHNPGKEGYRYDVIHPVTKKPCKQPLMGYRFPERTMKELISADKILFGETEEKIIELKLYAHEFVDKLPSVIELDGRLGMYDLRELFPEKNKIFNNPKPVELIKHLLSFATTKDDIILDSFAGSGTTGHAVLSLNGDDGNTRNFILIEMEDHIAKSTTAERVARAIKRFGYKAGFEYCELDKPLFDENGQIDESCDFKQFATYIYFTETQTNIDAKKISGNYIGESGDTEYYLLYKGKLENDLDRSALKIISDTDRKKVIYADRCLLDEDELVRYNITFKQIPYEVKVY
ncbi:MAG: site-specific DNA-methyltransferase [bacterium]|nr:site-specific DNA-methyltransferase [bacterium]